MNLKDIHWDKVFGVINATRNMKRNQTRPLRTEIVEEALADYSNGMLKYVGDTADGMDFEGADGLRYECKLQGTIFPKTKRTKNTRQIVGKNFRGKCLGIPAKTFDKIIMIDTGVSTVGIADFEDCQWKIKDAVANLKVLVDKVEIIVHNVKADEGLSQIDFNSVIKNAIKESVNENSKHHRHAKHNTRD